MSVFVDGKMGVTVPRQVCVAALACLPTDSLLFCVFRGFQDDLNSSLWVGGWSLIFLLF